MRWSGSRSRAVLRPTTRGNASSNTNARSALRQRKVRGRAGATAHTARPTQTPPAPRPRLRRRTCAWRSRPCSARGGRGWVRACGNGLCAARRGRGEACLHQHGDGHGADAAGDWRDHGGHAADVLGYVADHAVAALGRGVVHGVDANVNDDGTRLDPVRFHERGLADGGDQNVGLRAGEADRSRAPANGGPRPAARGWRAPRE